MLRTFIALAIAVAAMVGPAAAEVGLAPAPAPATAAAALSAQALYADALAKEQAVRKAITNGMPAAALGRAVRSVFAAYDAVVRQYPTSGYSDDALWRAAQLATEVAAVLHDAAYQATAARYVSRLASEYPSSQHARQLPASVIAAARSAPLRPAATPVPAAASVPATPVMPAPAAASTGAVPAATGSAAASREASAAAGRSSPASVAPADEPASDAVAAPPPTRAPGKARLLAIHRAVLPDVVRLTLDIDQEVTFRQERLSGPDRIFFDFSRTAAARSLAERTVRFDHDSDIVRQIRIGQQSGDTTRVVLDARGVASCSASPLYDPYRLVIDCVRVSTAAAAADAGTRPAAAPVPGPAKPTPAKASATTAAGTRPTPLTPATFARKTPAATPAAGSTPPPPMIALPARATAPLMAVRPALYAHRTPAVWAAALPTATRVPAAALAALTALPEATVPPAAMLAGAMVAPAAATATIAAPPSGRAPAAVAAPVAPARNLDGGLSIARQLGLTVTRVVIDPGHGGHDPGAKGAGTTEATVVLDIALRLETMLQREGIEVVLTRRTDDFVPLEERTAIANREEADLFLSIHANASSLARAAGVETYFLNFASNRSAAAVAARENAASGKSMSALPDVVRAIAMNGKLDESREFATHVQRALVQKLKPAHQGLRDLGVKQAPFVVLIGAAMPSVLAEVSFMTNQQEARLLKAQNYRQRIAEALFTAVQRYQSSLTRATDVVGQ